MRSRHQSIDWGQCFVLIFFIFCDLEILANFVTKITKLVKFTLEKKIFLKNFPDYFVTKKKKKKKREKI